jgi:hypothetical protein
MDSALMSKWTLFGAQSWTTSIASSAMRASASA